LFTNKNPRDKRGLFIYTDGSPYGNIEQGTDEGAPTSSFDIPCSIFLRFGLHVTFYRLAGTNQIPVSVGIIYSCHRRPEFIQGNIIQREGSLLPRITMLPFIGGYNKLRMWCMLQRVIFLISFSFFNSFYFFTDAE